MHKIRIKADRYSTHREKMKEYGSMPGVEYCPVDMYGRKISKPGDDIQEMAEEVRDYFGLDVKGY